MTVPNQYSFCKTKVSTEISMRFGPKVGEIPAGTIGTIVDFGAVTGDPIVEFNINKDWQVQVVIPFSDLNPIT